VELVTAGANYDEIAQRFQATSGTDNGPDLVGAGDVWWFRYMINGQIIPLEGLAQHLQIDTADYNRTLYDDYAFDGQHWALPYARSMPLFYYNRDVWQRAGLPDRAPQTWDEFEQWAPALAGVTGAPPLGLGTGTSWTAWWFCNIMWGRGGAYSDEWTLTLDRPETPEAGEYLRPMINDRRVAAVAAADYVADFSAGVSACTIASTGSLTGVLEQAQFEVGTGFLPQGPAGPGCLTGGTGIAIPSARSPEQQLAAGMFLKFLTEPEQTANFSAGTGYIPVRTSATAGPEMAAIDAERPQFCTAVDQLETTRVQDWARAFVPSGDQYLTTALERIMLQNEDPAAAFSAAAAEITASYEQNVARYL
jgi:sn-glycerol 3-phosphate transport system substrate-binding protein